MKKKGWRYAVIIILLCGAAAWISVRRSHQTSPNWEAYGSARFIPADQLPKRGSDGGDEEETVSDEEPETYPVEYEETARGEPYVCPVDFETLQAENPDIYALLSVTQTQISYPVAQREDDTYYLTHGLDGTVSSAGAIFSESRYNTTGMADAITVLYGHRMKSGAMFGSLQLIYSSLEQLREHNEIAVYTPERGYRYQVFAAVPYDARHIMYTYGDGSVRGRQAFLESIRSVRSLDAYVDDEADADDTDTLLVLSTCLYGDASKRFIVVAKLVEIL